PVCLVADVGHAALGLDAESRGGREPQAVPGVPSELLRMYEDHVLGKVYADWTFARAGDALRRYHGRDQARALAVLLDQFRKRAGFPGAELSPAVLKPLLEGSPDEALGETLEGLQRDGLHPVLDELLRSLIAAARRTAEILDPDQDIFHLEHGT